MISGVAPATGAKEALDNDNGERRGSTSSEGSATSGTASHGRTLCMETMEYIQAAKSRASTAAPPKPAANPLKFVKVGPCHLYRSAQEQLKKAEEVKKFAAKDVRKEEQEDWQSNLDSWKTSRRKQVEHIIERCVEVKRFEMEDSDRGRRRSKTFNEIMEDRAGRRNGRAPLPVYCEEDNNDLSDLGIGTSSASGKSSLSEDGDNHSLASDGMDLDKNHSDLDNMSDMPNRKHGSSANEYDTCTTATISSPEPEEYTYEGAIESYKSRIISRTQSTEIASTFNGIKDKSPMIVTRKPTVGSKIENKLSSFEQRRESSVEMNAKDKTIPKVDILKKRELFEKETSPEVVAKPAVSKQNGDLNNATSVKERLSHLEKMSIENTAINQKVFNQPVAKSNGIKEKLNTLEKMSIEPESVQVKPSDGDLTSICLKDRLDTFNNRSAPEKTVVNNVFAPVVSQSIKDRLADLDSACNKETVKQLPEANRFDSKDLIHERSYDNGLGDNKRLHRSLDSLDTDENLPDEKFQRIQSLDDLSGDGPEDTDREDSGIHTGDVSCAVSQDDEPFHIPVAAAPIEVIVPKVEEHENDIISTEDNSGVFFDREEDDTVKSLDADNSVFDALDSAFQMIDCEDQPDTGKNMSQIPNKTPSEPTIVLNSKKIEVTKVKPIPLYENIDILSPSEGIFNDVIGFPLGPPNNALQPPKEKPPPPPIEESDEIQEPMKRMNSTKRIKKEIRNKRSSFLGIEGIDDDSYLEAELKLPPKPDITPFLQEESRIERMFKKSLYYDSDSNLGESRDSGVELDRAQSDDMWSNKQASPDILSEQHSRQGSEPFTNTSITSEEGDAAKKEKEIILHAAPDVMGHQLTTKLKELELEKLHIENQSKMESEKIKDGDDSRLKLLEEQIREQQSNKIIKGCNDFYDDGHSEEVLRVERELLQLEQEELKRKRDSLLYKEKLNGRSLQDINAVQSYQSSLINTPAYQYAQPPVASNTANYRQSMPNLAIKPPDLSLYANSSAIVSYPKTNANHLKKLPPPVPPAKPSRSIEMQEREITLRNSRVPSADYSNIDELMVRQKSCEQLNQPNGTYSCNQMSRNTLQALSAAPRSRLSAGPEWLQPKRRSEPPQNYDYNKHWLIQEAEQRRIDQLRSNIQKQSQSPGTRPKHLPDAVIQTLTQRVQNMNGARPAPVAQTPIAESSEKMLSVSGKKKCSHCGEELGRGAAMIIESLRLFYHLSCFQCCVCGIRLGDGRLGADVRVRHNQLHCHNCYSSDDGVKFSCV